MARVEPYSFSKLFIWGSARGQFWMVVVHALGLVNSFIVVAALSVYHYGFYQLILSAAAIAGSISSGIFDDIIPNELVRQTAQGETSRAKRLYLENFALIAVLGFAAGALLFGAADAVAVWYDSDIGGYLRLMSALVVINALRSAVNLLFRVTLTFATFGAGALQEAIRLVALAALWQAGHLGLGEVLMVSVAASAAVLIYVLVVGLGEYRRAFGAVRALSEPVLKGIVIRYGRWAITRYGFSKIFKQMDTWFVRVFLGTEAVGLYGLAVNLLTLAQSLFPMRMFANLIPWEVDNERRMAFLYRRAVKYIVWFSLAVIAAGLAVVPPLIVAFLPKYRPALPLFAALLITLPLYGVYKLQKTTLVALREQKALTVRVLTETLVTAAVWAVTLPLIGLYGMVVEFFVTYGGRVIFFSYILNRRHPHLRLKTAHFFGVDGEDRAFFARACRELINPMRWLESIRVRR